jgi:hypothetical protein
MKLFGLVAGACLWLATATASPQFAAVAAEDESPVSIVRNIYLQYEDGGELIDVPEMYFTPSLLELWRAVEAGGEKSVEAALGFPVFNNDGEDETIAIDDVRFDFLAEKYVIASYVVLVEDEKSIGATKKYFQYNFQNTNDGWKIDNIDWGRDKKTLRQYLTEIKALRSLQ